MLNLKKKCLSCAYFLNVSGVISVKFWSNILWSKMKVENIKTAVSYLNSLFDFGIFCFRIVLIHEQPKLTNHYNVKGCFYFLN